jgi:hypothetical protein
MANLLEYRCRSCGELHVGLPAWHFATPVQALGIPREERRARVELTEDACIIDGREFYLKGLLHLSVHGSDEPFTWGVWLSVSDESYRRCSALFGDTERKAGESFFGWLCNALPGYPDTQLLKTYLHVQAYPLRPWVELEPTGHPLAIDQREGISRERAIWMAEQLWHPPTDAEDDGLRPAI